MKIYSLLCIILLAAIAGTGLSQSKTDPSQVIVITIGTVNKIDEKATSISLINATSATFKVPKQSASPGDNAGRSASRGGGSRGGKNGGSSDRPDTGTKNYPTPSGSAEGIPRNAGVTNYKIRILPTTVFKDGDKEIKLTDFKVGDTVEVTSPKAGSTLDAIEVARMHREGN